MPTLEDFYADYENMVIKFCEPYYNFLSVAADAVPKDTQSICDLGIGTGNLSIKIQRRIPNVKIYGIDFQEHLTKIAKTKLKEAIIFNRDMFAVPFPKVDYMVSSLAIHHFDTYTRIQKLINIVKSARYGLINFDFMLFDGNTFDDVIQIVLSFSKKYFPDKESLEQIENEIRKDDNPMPLEEQKDLFESLGMKFKILAKQAPFVVYKASWPTKNE